MKNNSNYTMLTDFYEITMANGYLEKGFRDKEVCFDMFFRKIPDGGGFAVMAGVEQLVDYLENLHFDDNDIEFLRSKNMFCDKFLEYLKNFRFECDVWTVEEGMPIFPGEPIVKVKGPVMQAQFIETMLLLTINHQSLVATKANRIVRAAKGRPVMEFGSRRAQGPNGAIDGARAAYIAGCCGTACTISDVRYGIPALGTMAHSWVQLFNSEYEAFCAYAEIYPQNCTLLIDTYNVLKSGLPNAIRAFNDVLVPKGIRPAGVRIDSGDITYLSKKIRKILDAEGFSDCKIVASNSLDEYIIRDILDQGAVIDSFGVGERLITSRSEPVFGGVYKLCAVYDENGGEIPKIKLSENVEKITTPCAKNVYRLYENETHKAIADVLTLEKEDVPCGEYELFDPIHTWKRKTITDFYAKSLLVKIFDKGRLVYDLPNIERIRNKCKTEVDNLWDEVKRWENPHNYYVDLSLDLWKIKDELLNKKSF